MRGLFIYFKRRYISFVLLYCFFFLFYFTHGYLCVPLRLMTGWSSSVVCVCRSVCYHEWYLCVSQFDWFYLLHCWIVFGIMMMMMMPTFEALWYCIWYTSSFLNVLFRFVSSIYPQHHKHFFSSFELQHIYFFYSFFLFSPAPLCADLIPSYLFSMPSSIDIFLSFHVWIPLEDKHGKGNQRPTHRRCLGFRFHCGVLICSCNTL